MSTENERHENEVELQDVQLEEVSGGGKGGAPFCPYCGAGPEMQVEASVAPGSGYMGYKCTKCGKTW